MSCLFVDRSSSSSRNPQIDIKMNDDEYILCIGRSTRINSLSLVFFFCFFTRNLVVEEAGGRRPKKCTNGQRLVVDSFLRVGFFVTHSKQQQAVLV